ncbi:MAG: hypothetical protein DRJ38_09505 [Thermoprotei archaeon]|nr:MAG: hypothetical protein DRJ38_09505 [Thermoprotei archaeon]
MDYTTVKVSKNVKDRLKSYARRKGLSLGAAINSLLEESEILKELRAIKKLLEEQNHLLRELTRGKLVTVEPSAEPIVSELPDFVSDNPWTAVLARRGRD